MTQRLINLHDLSLIYVYCGWGERGGGHILKLFHR